MTMSRTAVNVRIGWGLIGASNIARLRVAGAIQHSDDGRLVAIASHRLDLAQAFAAQFNIPSAYDSIEPLLADPGVAAVYISSTNQHHFAQVLAAAAAGKHVLCEKPLAMRLEDAIEMVRACRAAGVVMGTNHHLRNSTTIRAMRQVVLAGNIGRPISAIVSQPVLVPADEWRRRDPTAGSGVSFDVLVHGADVIRFILDQEPVVVTAIGQTSASMADGANDSIMATFRFDGGALAQLYADFNTPQARTRVEIHGTEASLVGTDVLGKITDFRGRVTLRRDGVESEVAVESDHSRYGIGVNCFNAAIRGCGQVFCSGVDGVRSLAMVLAAEEAARSGKTVQVSAAGLEIAR
jgi:1,5-anhydro-D-fructose reductase (1,5-anhydro-D-mannitol-forming)